MKKTILLSTLLLSLVCAFAQAPDSSQLYDSQLNAAYDYANTYNTQSIRPYNPEKAFAICLNLANKGIPRAMNAVGLMCQAGLGTDTNYTAAAAWFEKAGQAGYAVAWVNLGMIYKYAYGVNQDMDKACSCYQKASDLGSDYGKHALGYMLFKGLGGRQDYAAAFQLFRESTESNNLGGMYMLGICYRNGYGTERDTLMAKKWLKKADSLGFYVAPSELYAKEPENKLVKKTKLKSSRMVAGGDSLKPQIFKRIKNKVAGNTISAEYAGYVITYDHSGQHMIKQAPLRLTLKANGNALTGQWIESDTLVTDIKAQLTDSCIIFTRAQYRYTDHYNTSPTLWKFTKASLDIVKTGDSVYLVGNLQLYSPETMEPEKPIYISLVKTSGTTNGVLREATSTDLAPQASPFIAFPNPFVQELNLDFTLEKAGEVEISIFNMQGNKVYEALTGELPAGKNIQTIPVNLPTGMYAVKITSGSYKASSIVLKQ